MRSLLIDIFLFLICFVLSAQNITHIDITKAKLEEVNAEKVFEELEIVRLETHKDGLLKVRNDFYLTDKYIIATPFLEKAYLFDRKTGKFIREISKEGQGPHEYSGWIYHKYGFDEKNNILFANDWISVGGIWKGINIESNKIEYHINQPMSENENEILSVTAPWLIKEGIYVTFINNRTGKDKVKLVVSDKEGNIIKKYPNYLEYEKKNIHGFPANNGIFYYYNGNTYFKEMSYNDTIFCVNEHSITPHIVLQMGNRQPSYYHQETKEDRIGKYLIEFVYESKGFVLFNFFYQPDSKEMHGMLIGGSTHVGYYDKKNKQVYISSKPDLKKGGYVVSGLPVRFHPSSINKKGEMIGVIDPEQLVENQNEISSNYKHILKDLQEDDNPVVIIGKLKN